MATVIAQGFVDNAIVVAFALVLAFGSNGALEETSATVARINTVVFSGAIVAANETRRVVENATCE